MACNEYTLCKNAYYEQQPSKLIILKCKADRDICPYSKYCSSLLKIIHTSAYMQCARGKVNYE